MATSKPTSTTDYVCEIDKGVHSMNSLLGHCIVDLRDLLKKKNSTEETQAVLQLDEKFCGEKDHLKNQLDEFYNLYEQLRPATLLRDKKGRHGEEQEDSGYMGSQDSNLFEGDDLPPKRGIQDATPHDSSQVRRARMLTESFIEHLELPFNKDS
ncbi:uncharacterized protein LOC143054110 [Mytilus galloprovincialis]|uniref:uncharacterized protein LOC143054110 n=1 Tax=Mytilus galloprovincialis TaxID=29158 RepID=UPI003F7BDB82